MKSIHLTRRNFLALAAAGAAAAAVRSARAEAALNVVGRTPAPQAGEPVSRLKIADPARIKALQFTDVHFFAAPEVPSSDKRTQEELPRLIEHAQPDLLMISGDLWHDNPEGRGREYMEFAIGQIESLGVPWLFTWGNHDQLDDYAAGHAYIAAAKGSLYAGGATGGHYRVELTDASGEVRWELPCLNSSDRGADAHAIAWLDALAAERADTKRVPALGVAHIPLTQYVDLWSSGEAEGVKLEDVCTWDSAPGVLAAWQRAFGLRGVICGHDHVNNYSGLIDGVELIYGQATGTSGYGGDSVPKGARLYTLNAESGSFASEVVFPDGTRWSAPDGWSTDQVADVPWDTPKKRQAERRNRPSGNA
jgi:hypothetical protein